jgi:hypothetical protein
MTMKKSGVLVAAIGTMMLMSGLHSRAQDTTFSFHMSTSFYAGNAKMPAGAYTLKPSEDDPSAYELQNSSGTHSVILEARQSSKTSKGKPEILFNRYGTTDYLEAVETSTGNSIDIEPGVAEKLAAKKGAAQKHTIPAA